MEHTDTDPAVANGRRFVTPLQTGWRFFKYAQEETPDDLYYALRPSIEDPHTVKEADARPTEAVALEAEAAARKGLRDWILPSANPFIKDSSKHYRAPAGNPGGDFPFVQSGFDDRDWEAVRVPHDWAIGGPFMDGPHPRVGGGMGRLPVDGVAWYRLRFPVSEEARGKRVVLEVDGAMSYAAVWVNGRLAGGWPYGYASWALDISDLVVPGGENLLAILVDNPNHSARWSPGAGLYREVRLVITDRVHLGQWGVTIQTPEVSIERARVERRAVIANDTNRSVTAAVHTELVALPAAGNAETAAAGRVKAAAAEALHFPVQTVAIPAGGEAAVEGAISLENPLLWGPPPAQRPNRYRAITRIEVEGRVVDAYETVFGIRRVDFDPERGCLVNGECIPLQGVNLHHDLGALGAAFNHSAARRQLERLADLGANALRMAHNPPDPVFLDLCDEMGFLVFDEIFDCWELKKTPHDFHLIFADWSEPDLRAFIRRDRNHPSVVIWGFGNEVGEQYTDEDGAAIARRLYDILKEEDPTRPASLAMNYAKPDMALPTVPDLISLNYQGEGIRQEPEFEGTDRIRTPPQYPAFKARFPQKPILSSETASAFSSRGVYLFPVSPLVSAPVRQGRGGDETIHQVSAYELHAVDFGSTAEKVFASLEKHPFSAGEFVWTGWDHLGEPTPYYEARSSYCGIIDLAGFPKDRYYLYQSQWRPDLPMAHLLPHWTWPERAGLVTPVHAFTSGDEAELFLTGRSLGRKKKGQYEYRLRWDEVIYEPGELELVAYKNGQEWARDRLSTAGEPAGLAVHSARQTLAADGEDLAFVEISVVDGVGQICPRANVLLDVVVEGEGSLVALDNGDPTDMTGFHEGRRRAFSGRLLAIVRGKGRAGVGAGGEAGGEAGGDSRPAAPGSHPASITVRVSGEGLVSGSLQLAICG